jgi:hypothetical protein
VDETIFAFFATTNSGAAGDSDCDVFEVFVRGGVEGAETVVSETGFLEEIHVLACSAREPVLSQRHFFFSSMDRGAWSSAGGASGLARAADGDRVAPKTRAAATPARFVSGARPHVGELEGLEVAVPVHEPPRGQVRERQRLRLHHVAAHQRALLRLRRDDHRRPVARVAETERRRAGGPRGERSAGVVEEREGKDVLFGRAFP